MLFLVADSTLCRVGRWVRPSVHKSVRKSVTLLNCEGFLHYCSCPTDRDRIAVYPALFYSARHAVQSFIIAPYHVLSRIIVSISIRITDIPDDKNIGGGDPKEQTAENCGLCYGYHLTATVRATKILSAFFSFITAFFFF